MVDRLNPDVPKQFPLSRNTVKDIIDDFPAIETSQDERAIATHTEKARGYLEDIQNLPADERKTWSPEIDGLHGILRSWEKKKNPNLG